MYNSVLDEYNHMIWEQRIEELKFMLIDDDIDLNDVDRLGRTMLLQAIESMEFSEDSGVFKPQERWLDFMEWLLKKGTDPNLPENLPPIEYALDSESDISNQKDSIYDMTDVLKLLRRYGAVTEKYDALIDGGVHNRLDYKWENKQ